MYKFFKTYKYIVLLCVCSMFFLIIGYYIYLSRQFNYMVYFNKYIIHYIHVLADAEPRMPLEVYASRLIFDMGINKMYLSGLITDDNLLHMGEQFGIAMGVKDPVSFSLDFAFIVPIAINKISG